MQDKFLLTVGRHCDLPDGGEAVWQTKKQVASSPPLADHRKDAFLLKWDFCRAPVPL